jgi:ribosomal protein L39E
MIQGNEYLKVDNVYSSLISPVKTPENKEEDSTKNNKSKIHDLFKQPQVKTSDTVPNSKVLFYISEENQNTSIELLDDNKNTSIIEEKKVVENSKKLKTDTAYQAINKTQTAVTVAETIAKLTNQDGFGDLIKSSSGVLTASKALIELDNVDESENKTKTVMSSLSQVANGVGTVLSVVNVPEAQFLTFTGKVLGLGVEQQDLNENIKKKDARGIVGTSVSLAKGSWGTVVSGLEAAKLATSLGHKAGIVSVATVGKVATTTTKISKFADKVAVPFAVAGTALNLWDLKNDYDKVKSKKQELAIVKNENNEIPQRIRMKTSSNEEKLEKELNSLETNMTFRGISFGLSAISTTALIVSVAYPPASSVANIVTLGGNIASGIAGTLSTQEKRDSALNAYEGIKTKYDGFLAKVDHFVFALKKKD